MKAGLKREEMGEREKTRQKRKKNGINECEKCTERVILLVLIKLLELSVEQGEGVYESD